MISQFDLTETSQDSGLIYHSLKNLFANNLQDLENEDYTMSRLNPAQKVHFAILVISTITNNFCPPLFFPGEMPRSKINNNEEMKDVVKEHTAWLRKMKLDFKQLKTKSGKLCSSVSTQENAMDKYSSIKNDFEFIQQQILQSHQSVEQFNANLSSPVKSSVNVIFKDMETFSEEVSIEIRKLRLYQAAQTQKKS